MSKHAKFSILIFLAGIAIIYFIFSSINARTPSKLKNLNPKVPTQLSDTSSMLSYKNIQGALLGTRFQSYEELQSVVKIVYFDQGQSTVFHPQSPSSVLLIHESNGQTVISKLKEGISEKDIIRARDGGFWDKAYLAFHSPYFLFNRWDILRIFILSRKRGQIFGVGDVAFYNLAEAMMENIMEEDSLRLPAKDFSEKGFINTFNHVSSQAFMTTLFSEKMADYIADIHERATMPALITGEFTDEQIKDLEFGALDNYVDIINNEWGQEIGKELRKKYQITRKTVWTPQLLANYLNDLQSYYSWSLQIGFHPFKPTDEVVIRFAYKLNRVMEKVKGMS